MRVVNNDKARAKTYLRNDIGSNMTNIMNESNRVQDLVSQLSQTMSGSMSGIDKDLIGNAQQSLQYISQALQYLQQAYNTAGQLDVTEEIPDEQY